MKNNRKDRDRSLNREKKKKKEEKKNKRVKLLGSKINLGAVINMFNKINQIRFHDFIKSRVNFIF